MLFHCSLESIRQLQYYVCGDLSRSTIASPMFNRTFLSNFNNILTNCTVTIYFQLIKFWERLIVDGWNNQNITLRVHRCLFEQIQKHTHTMHTSNKKFYSTNVLVNDYTTNTTRISLSVVFFELLYFLCATVIWFLHIFYLKIVNRCW